MVASTAHPVSLLVERIHPHKPHRVSRTSLSSRERKQRSAIALPGANPVKFFSAVRKKTENPNEGWDEDSRVVSRPLLLFFFLSCL